MPTSPPIAIVGMSSLFAGSHDLLGFWRDIVSATDRLTDVPPHMWLIEDYYDPDPSAADMTYAKRGGFLEPLPFNPMEFGLPPTTIPATDSAQLIALVAAKRVLADAARFRDGDVDNSRTSVILGVASTTELVVQMGSRLQHPIWRKALRDAGLPESQVQEIVQRIKDHYQPWKESTFPGLLGNVVAGRIANRLDLGGSNFVTDAACASSISALQAGLAELYLGDSDMVIAGGVDALNDILMYMCFSKTPAFSPTGDCRPFSDEADGTLIGEGVGMLALRRLEDAEADGDPIYAIVRGLGASSDGKGSSVYAPRSEGQANALRRAYDKADYSPATVELVEAHGTATKAGDAAEVGGLTSVFGPANEEGKQWCALGSVKSQIGHTKAAAGAAGLIKVALALHHKVLPPTLKVSKPNEKLGMGEGPLYINTETRPWIRGSEHPRRGSVSSFGFGGSNFHVALEEYTGSGRRPDRLRTWSEELVVLSATSPAELGTRLAALQERVEAGDPLGLIAYDCAHDFDSGGAARVSLVADSPEELSAKAARAAKAIVDGTTDAIPDADIAFGFGDATVGKVAFVFPGQGSQYVGMGAGVAMAFDGAREVWDAAVDMDEFVHDRLDRAVFPPPAFSDDERAEQQRALTKMATAQPAIAAVSLGFLHLLRKLGVAPDAVAGHSFGELSALAAAGRMQESALLATARKRGELMAEAAAHHDGAMIAVSTDAETLAGLIREHPGVVVANDNAPTEVVLAGTVEAIDAVAKDLTAQGLTTIRLPVASAFHSSIVAESCAPFHDYLSSVKWSAGDVAVYANTSASVYPKTAKACRRILADQLESPVRFREMVEAMYEGGATHFVEVGPGRVLTKLVSRCLGDRPHVAVSLDDKNSSGLRAFWRGLGKLAAEGIELNLSILSEGYRVPDAPVEAQPFDIMITGANHDKPYPPENGAAGLPAPNPELPEPSQVAPTPVAAAAPTPPTAPSVPAPVQPVSAPVAAAPLAPVNAAATAQVHQITIEAHRRYQELMAESHKAFLAMASNALGQVSGVVTPGVPMQAPVVAHPPVAAVPLAQPVAAPTPAVVAPTPALVAPVVEPTASPQPVAPVAPVAAAVDVTALALEVVSEKTGYPVEMLDLDMEMEAGLGIDSIKQVEILSELQERLPGIPEISPSELATLRTLRDVADKLTVEGTVAPATPAAIPAPSATPSAAVTPAVDVTALALEVVAEKTGYPVEMLDLDMEMEAGLGIDSIKQVEILSELQERLPGIPEISPAELASLRTLRDVADKLTVEGEVAPAPAPSATPSAAVSAAPAVDVTALALEVVAEKTGYPVEMLDLDMEMEAGLGIDSIKQVEILSELQERLPGVPEISPSELAGLRTLRDVADKLQPGAPDSAPAGTESAETPIVASVTPSIPEPTEPTPVAAFVPRIVPRLRPGFGLSGLSRGVEVQVTDENPTLASELAAGLAERGVRAEVVQAPSPDASAVICLAGLGAHEPGPEGSLAVHIAAIEAARIVAQHPDPSERMFVTVQATGGDFGLAGDPGEGAWTAGLAGVVKTADREWPGASLKAIDVADATSAASAILDELFLGGPAIEVGIAANGERSVVQIERLPRDGAQSAPLEAGSVVVVSGGARGVTASSVAKLAETWNVRLALLGRSKLVEWPEGVPLSTDAVQLTGALAAAAKGRGETVDLAGIQQQARTLAASAEVRMSLAELDARGIETLYLSADVTDAEQIGEALANVRERWGPISGIVHGAGVLRDKALAEITPDRVADVFAPKVGGLSVLLEATEADPIQMIALFSSIAARAGNAGQAAYSAANEVLNKVAAAEAHRRGGACRVRSYNWGPWAGGMVDAGLAAHFEKQGIALLDVDTGAQFFVDELTLDGAGVERVVLAAPSFPASTHNLTFSTDAEEAGSDGGSGGSRLAPALVADFALRLGQALKPVRNMRTYLEDFVIAMRAGVATTGGHTVEIHPIVAAIPGYRLIFKDSAGNAHHETMVRYSESGSEPPPAVPSGDLEPWPFGAEAAYDDVLGTSSAHRSIVDLEGVSEEGGMALLRSAASLGWPPKGFARGFDPATFEGLLQLGELWTHHKAGAMQKIARVGTMVVHHLETLPERLRSGFRARQTEKGTLFDFILATEEGDLVAELREVQFDAPSV
jgi:acyl transferase domain-containing protein/NADP-dependent 3-hydroxy acid dehydrogenase YdfG